MDNIKPYDNEVADAIFAKLFWTREYTTEDGLREIPAASYQMVVSALDLFLGEVKDEAKRKSIKQTIGVVQNLRDKQKMREWKRRNESA